jgi:hypothetical protein
LDLDEAGDEDKANNLAELSKAILFDRLVLAEGANNVVVAQGSEVKGVEHSAVSWIGLLEVEGEEGKINEAFSNEVGAVEGALRDGVVLEAKSDGEGVGTGAREEIPDVVEEHVGTDFLHQKL